MAKVMICDDAAFMRMMIKDILTKNGYEIAAEAENGAIAVEKYPEAKPDLVLMDITMPDMDGIQALKKIKENAGLCIYNLGTGTGYSVLDIVKNFEAATGVKIPYVIKDRRPGDIATCYSDASKAKRELGWEAEYGILEMCRDSWNWQKKNPNGY